MLASRASNRRPSRRPTPSTPRTSSLQNIGAVMTSVNPSYAGCGTGAAISPYALSTSGRPFAHRSAGETLTHRKLEAEQPGGETVHRDAAEDAAFAVEEIAVGGIGVEELGELVGQPLQHHRQVELAAQHVRRPEQSGLLRELLLVSLQRLFERNARAQPFERDGRLRGERLHHLEILAREDAGLVERRDRDHRRHAILDEKRNERRALCADRTHEARADHT